MPLGSFRTQFNYFQIRNENVWFTDLPVISVTAKKSALDMNGSYKITLPNPRGIALDKFYHFDNQELWFAYIPTSTMSRFLSGQVNKINPNKNGTVTIEGRGLSGLFMDRKVNDSWDDKRVDFILCDETYGAIPTTYGNEITTWNAFTDEYDRFDYWNTTRWGTIPSYCEIIDGEMEMTGHPAGTRTVFGATEYNYEVIEFRAKVSSDGDFVRFGFSNAARTEYVQFELANGMVNCENDDGVLEKSAATTNVITQTDYNYYRIEWDNADVRFFVNGVLEAEESSNVPNGLLKPFFEMEDNGEVLTFDFMKVITLTTEIDAYLSKQKVFTDVVKELCDIGNSTSSFMYYLDNSRDFHSFVKKAVSSGNGYGFNSSIYNGTYERISKLDLNEEAKDLYNLVTIKGGEILTTVAAPAWTDETLGDGTTTAFPLGYKAKKPLTRTEVNAVAKTEDTDFTVTYGKEHTIVKFAVAPANGHSINFRYDYYTPIIASSRNKTSIDRYKVTREYYKSDETITSQERARDYAGALLAYFSDPRTVITVRIPLTPNLDVGETVMIDASFYGITNTDYEIIDIELTMAVGKWESKLILANSEINTSAEIIREILQQLKDLRTRGDTTEVITSEEILDEGIETTEKLEYKPRYICDSFILGHDENGIFGREGKPLFHFTDKNDWTTTDFTLTDNADTDYIWTYDKSMKATWNTTGDGDLYATNNQGDLSGATGVNSGTPSKGTVGLWVYRVSGTTFGDIVLKIGKDSSNYHVYTSSSYLSLTQGNGWNYIIFDLNNPDSETGTNDWTDVQYINLTIDRTSATGTIYLEYMSISESNSIGLNALGYRFLEGEYSTIATG